MPEIGEPKVLFVKDLKDKELNEEIKTYFMVKNAEIRTGNNGKEYMDVTFMDKTGEINGKRWDVKAEDHESLKCVKEGEIIKVIAQVSEWQGQPQLRINKVRPISDVDFIDMSLFVKAAPEPSEEMYNFIIGIAESFKDEDLKKIALKLLNDNKDRLFYYPAAAKNHHAEFGGLLWHMKRMLLAGEKLSEVYTFINRDLLLCGVIIHDMEKLNEIDSNENGMATGYSMVGQLIGHISQGVAAISELCHQMDIPEEKTIMLEHMVLSHHYEPDFGSPKKPMFAEAELLHYLDIIDARMYDMEEAVQGLEPGSFSDRVWTLDNRRIYKPTF